MNQTYKVELMTRVFIGKTECEICHTDTGGLSFDDEAEARAFMHFNKVILCKTCFESAEEGAVEQKFKFTKLEYYEGIDHS